MKHLKALLRPVPFPQVRFRDFAIFFSLLWMLGACIAAYAAPALVHNNSGEQSYPSYQNAYSHSTAYSSGESVSITNLPAKVGSDVTNTGVGGTLATSVTPTSGNNYCLIVSAYGWRGSTLTINDNLSSSYTLLDTETPLYGKGYVWYLNNVPSGITTINIVDSYGSTGDGVSVMIREYNSVQTVALGANNTVNGSISFNGSGFSYSATKQALAIGYYTQRGDQSTTVDSTDGWGNFTFLQNTNQPSTYPNSEIGSFMEDAAASVSGAQTHGSRHTLPTYTAYGWSDVVLLTGAPAYYTCIASSTGNDPPNLTYWVPGNDAAVSVTSTGAGNTLVIFIADLQNKATNGVWDSAGDTFSAINSDGNTKGIYAFYCTGIAAGTTKLYLQTSNTGATNVSYQINEYSGLTTFDSFVTNSGSSATVATTGFTYAQAKELVITAGAYTYTTSPTVDSGHGFGNFFNSTYGSAGTADNCFVQDLNTSSTTGVNSSNTVSASASWASIQIAFKANTSNGVHTATILGIGS